MNYKKYLALFIFLFTMIFTISISKGETSQLALATPVPFPQMIYIEGGTFAMGDTFGWGKYGDEPKKENTVHDFYIGKYELTFNEYDAFCEATGRQKPSDQTWGRGNQPVINVSWEDAVDYCNWVSLQQGLAPAYTKKNGMVRCDFTANGYRLPTQTEWEYAAKDGKNNQSYQYSGSNDVSSVGWYKENTGKMPHPVGQKQPNELGLYDMSGNVWEWCWERDSTYRIIRGGSWLNEAVYLQTCFYYNYRSDSDSNVGFRVVRTVIN